MARKPRPATTARATPADIWTFPFVLGRVGHPECFLLAGGRPPDKGPPGSLAEVHMLSAGTCRSISRYLDTGVRAVVGHLDGGPPPSHTAVQRGLRAPATSRESANAQRPERGRARAPHGSPCILPAHPPPSGPGCWPYRECHRSRRCRGSSRHRLLRERRHRLGTHVGDGTKAVPRTHPKGSPTRCQEQGPPGHIQGCPAEVTTC